MARPSEDKPSRPAGETQSLARGLTVLDAFQFGESDVGISELAQRTGLKISTVHRIVRTLVACGYAEQNVRNDRYRLSRAAVMVGQVAVHQSGLNLVVPILEELRDRTGEAVNLGVQDGDEAVVLIRVECRQPLRFEQPPGSRIPLQVSAMGKVLIAFGRREWEGVLDELPTPSRFTRYTRTETREILADLRRVARRGYSLNDQERYLGVRSIGAPIRDEAGVAYAAISLQGPTARMTSTRVRALAADVIDTAEAVSSVLLKHPNVGTIDGP